MSDGFMLVTMWIMLWGGLAYALYTAACPDDESEQA